MMIWQWIIATLAVVLVFACEGDYHRNVSKQGMRSISTDGLDYTIADYLDLNLGAMPVLDGENLSLQAVALPGAGEFDQHLGWPIAATIGDETLVIFTRKRYHRGNGLDGQECGEAPKFDEDTSSSEMLARRNGNGPWWTENLRKHPSYIAATGGSTAHDSAKFAMAAIGEYTTESGDPGVVLLNRAGVWRFGADGDVELRRGVVTRIEPTGGLPWLGLGPRVVEIPMPGNRTNCGRRALIAFGNLGSDTVGEPNLHILLSIDYGANWSEHVISLPDGSDDGHRPAEPAALYLSQSGGRILLLTRNHAESSRDEGSPELRYGAMSFDGDALLMRVFSKTCGLSCSPIAHEDIGFKGAITNISSHAPAPPGQSPSYLGMDTTDLIYNPITERVEAAVTDRNGTVVDGDFDGMELVVWSIDPDQAADSPAVWDRKATLLKRTTRFHGAPPHTADGFHPAASVMVGGAQHIFVYSGNALIGGRAGIFELRRTLSTDTLNGLGMPRPPSLYDYVFGDFNGDGLTDFLKAHAEPGESRIYTARPGWLDPDFTGFVRHNAPFYHFRDTSGYLRVISADLDGDGRDDLVRMSDSGNLDTLFLSDNAIGDAPLFGRIENVTLPADFHLHTIDGQFLTQAVAFNGPAESECLLTMRSGTGDNSVLCWSGSALGVVTTIGYELYHQDKSIRTVSGNFAGGVGDELLRLHSQRTRHLLLYFSGSGATLQLSATQAVPAYDLHGANEPYTTLVGDFGGDSHLDLLRAHENVFLNTLFIRDQSCSQCAGGVCASGYCILDAPNEAFHHRGEVISRIGNFGGDPKDDLLRLWDDPTLVDDRPLTRIFLSSAAGGFAGGGVVENGVCGYPLFTNDGLIEPTVLHHDPSGASPFDYLLRDHGVDNLDIILESDGQQLTPIPLADPACDSE